MLPKWLQSDTGKIITGLLLVFVPIVGYTLLFPFYQNCLNMKMVMAIYLLIGALMGAAVAYWLRNRPELLIETFQLFIACIIFGMILFPMIATITNRLIKVGGPKVINSHVVKVEQFMQSRFGDLDLDIQADGYFVYTVLEGKVVRLNAEPNIDIQQYQPGKNIEVTIHSGILGLRWADPTFQSLE